MYKKITIIIASVFCICSCQHIDAGDRAEISHPPADPARPVKSSHPAPGISDGSGGFAAHKPSAPIVKLDFENEAVRLVRGKQDNYDFISVPTADGRAKPLYIYYEAGEPAARGARIETDPMDRNNRVLHYWLKHAQIPGQHRGAFKGRVQMNLGRIKESSVFQRYRLLLHPDLKFYRQYPGRNAWFGISTMWMGAKWRGHPYPFKISLNIIKAAGIGKPLYFGVAASVAAGGEVGKGVWKNIWSQMGANFEVPVGEWLDVEIGYRAGDRDSGRFYMGVRAEGEEKFVTVFDIEDWTYHPASPVSVPLTDWQPFKLYTSRRIIDFIRDSGGVTQLYFDDIELYQNW